MSKTSLLDLFPTPKFLNPPAAGLSFSQKNIRAVLLDGGSEKTLKSYHSVPLKPGTITNGTLANQKDFVAALLQIKNKIGVKYVSFTIPDELAYVFITSVPVSPGQDAASSIEFTIEENVPMSLHDVVFDFEPISTKEQDGGTVGEFVVAAASRSIVEAFTEAIRAAGFTPYKCMHESQAIASSVVPRGSKRTICVVHARPDRVGMYLVLNNIVHFSTIHPVVSTENYAQDVLDEYDKLNEYWSKYSSPKTDASISSFIVCGELEMAKIALDTLKMKTSLPTALADVWGNAVSLQKFIPSLPYEESLSFAAAIGMALK